MRHRPQEHPSWSLHPRDFRQFDNHRILRVLRIRRLQRSQLSAEELVRHPGARRPASGPPPQMNARMLNCLGVVVQSQGFFKL